MSLCLICQMELVKFGRAAGHEIFKCPNCGFGQTDKLVSQKDSYHRDDDYIKEESLFRNIFLKRIKIISSFKKTGKALEIGCSTGLMLSLLKNRGWNVSGVEISPKAAQVAGSRGLNVKSLSFEDINLDEKFDLVIFNHTLEHLENPQKNIEKAISLLNKKGILYIDVPNFGGLSAGLAKTNWSLLLPDEHLWHFTMHSMEILLKNNGLRIIFTDKSSGIWNMEEPLLEIFRSLVHLKKRFFEEVITAVPSWIVSKLGLGSDLMVIAQKL